MKTKTFTYDNKEFQRVEKHSNDCDGCWFEENGISCMPEDVPFCGYGIFVRIK